MASVADDRELVTRAGGGDESAFRAIVARHERALARTITAMLGPGDDADDVGQETFVRFFRALPRFRGDAQLGTYLTRIAVNLCCDVLQRRRKQARWLRLDDGECHALAAPDETDTLERAERRETVRRAVESLDGKHQAVVVLRIFEERSTREVATFLGIPEGTVMSRLKRALEKLAARLGPEWRS